MDTNAAYAGVKTTVVNGGAGADTKDTGLVNKVAIGGHITMDTILLISYLVELLKGKRTVGYFLIVAAFMVLPVIAELIVYSKKKDAVSIRHILAYSYGIFYLFALFTANATCIFVYIVPFFILLTVYSDIKYVTVIGLAGIIANLAWVVMTAVTTGIPSDQMADIEIRVACMVISGIFLWMSTKAVKQINESKLRIMEAQQEKNNELVDRIVETSDGMSAQITNASGQMELLADSMTKIHDSMGEVTKGSSETAQAVQAQLQRTEQIQEHIERVKNAAEGIGTNTTDTAQKVQEGQQHMSVLAGEVDKSIEANQQMVTQMQTLSEYTDQMNTIIETITSIANSTGMLALNASIEAARAGEAGRGFAVVASQISELANQTKTATVNITELIDHINRELQAVSEAAQTVTESNRSNAENTKVVVSNFGTIADGTKNITDVTGDLMTIVKELEAANADIVENIQTISAITEEVSAHANETYDACEENGRLVDSVTGIVSDITEKAQALQTAQN